MLLVLGMTYMYGYQEGISDGADRMRQRCRNDRDVELWNQMEDLFKYPSPYVERQCMGVLNGRGDITMTRTTDRGNRESLTENNNNQGTGRATRKKRKRRRKKKRNRKRNQ